MKQKLWTLLLAMVLAVCVVPTEASAAGVVESGIFHNSLFWTFLDDGTLRIGGNRNSLWEPQEYPFYKYKNQVKKLVFSGDFNVANDYQFSDWDKLSEITATSAYGCAFFESYAFYDCDGLIDITLPPLSLGIYEGAFAHCDNLTSVTFSEYKYELHGQIVTNIIYLADRIFLDCNSLCKLKFIGPPPDFSANAFESITANAYYPVGEKGWTTDIMQDYGGNITWIPYDPENEHIHTYNKIVISPTCREQGYDKYTCSCGDEYVDNYTEPTGHNYK